ncbi:uncharacterized protein LOC120170757 [Hibiscus syriacus]|uniref:uncharacterized protein LOC120170757 n=1 Tax=Hibiscus syriacus TaxID=106335 RepID=UPI001920C719|nr:uncharacterized protein LOC120170757 [Hibiscus syriacus]
MFGVLQVEFLKDYDYVIDYHPGKANVVVDALSIKSMTKLQALLTRLSLSNDGGFLTELQVKPELVGEVNMLQISDDQLRSFIEQVRQGEASGSNKMYQKLRRLFYWPGKKREVPEFVARCLICQQVKVEHQASSGLLKPIQIPHLK